MRHSLALLLLLTSSTALAFGTYRAGNKVLAPNDPAMKVLDTMGEPRMKEPVMNGYGAQIGEFWHYRDGSKTVKFFISGGRIVRIEEIR